MKMWVRAQRAVYDLGISILPIGRDDVTGNTSYVKNIEYETIEKGVMIPQNPVGITLDDDAARMLMDDLWTAGVRPSQGLNDVTDKTDIKNHLEDMRSIVFNGIKISIDEPNKG